MKTRLILSALAVLAIAAFSSPVFAQGEPAGGAGYMVGGFLDENGDGFNDLAPDIDGDGIPNGLDPDYTAVCDGTGLGLNLRTGECSEDGFIYRHGYNYNRSNGTTGFGPGDGTGNGGEGPGDGSGFGPGEGTGDGPCTPQLIGDGLAGRN